MFEIIDWLSGLDRVFAFMLALPFVVAIAGLLAEYWRHLRRHSHTASGGEIRGSSDSHGFHAWL